MSESPFVKDPENPTDAELAAAIQRGLADGSLVDAADWLAANKPQPADPELFRRTAPAWNCVDYPGDGPHYTPGNTCQWCGCTRDQITAEYQASQAPCSVCGVAKASHQSSEYHRYNHVWKA